MVGASDAIRIGEALDPAASVIAAVAVVWYVRRVVLDRVEDLEAVQEERRERLKENDLTRQEMTLLVDDNAERVDQVEDAAERLRERVRQLEAAYAAEHGTHPRRRGGPPRGGDGPQSAGSRPPPEDGSEGDEDDPSGGPSDGRMETVSRRLRDRIAHITDRQPPGWPRHPGDNLRRQHHKERGKPNDD